MAATMVPDTVLRQWVTAKRVELRAGRTEIRVPDRVLKAMHAAYRASICGVTDLARAGDPAAMPAH
jgi:hypothetical protein